jgi:hypothetical protein
MFQASRDGPSGQVWSRLPASGETGGSRNSEEEREELQQDVAEARRLTRVLVDRTTRPM